MKKHINEHISNEGEVVEKPHHDTQNLLEDSMLDVLKIEEVHHLGKNYHGYESEDQQAGHVESRVAKYLPCALLLLLDVDGCVSGEGWVEL